MEDVGAMAIVLPPRKLAPDPVIQMVSLHLYVVSSVL